MSVGFEVMKKKGNFRLWLKKYKYPRSGAFLLLNWTALGKAEFKLPK